MSRHAVTHRSPRQPPSHLAEQTGLTLARPGLRPELLQLSAVLTHCEESGHDTRFRLKGGGRIVHGNKPSQTYHQGLTLVLFSAQREHLL